MGQHVERLCKKGWQSAVTLCHCLHWIRGQQRYADGGRIELLLDSY